MRVSTQRDKTWVNPFADHEDAWGPYDDSVDPYGMRWDKVADSRSLRARASQSPVNSAVTRRTQVPSPVRHELPEPTFDVDEQPEIENEREVRIECETDCDGVVESRSGINKLGDEYHITKFNDGAEGYQYENRDGSFYEKDRDGKVIFIPHPRQRPEALRQGTLPGKSVRPGEGGEGEAIDVQPGWQ